MPKRLTNSRPTTWASALALSGAGTRWSKTTTILSGSATFSTSRQYERREVVVEQHGGIDVDDHEVARRDTRQAAGRARIFSTMVIAMRRPCSAAPKS